MMRWIEAGLALSIASVGGCAQIVGIEEWSATASGAGGAAASSGSSGSTSNATASGDSSASTGTGSTCDQCVPAEPPGWNGPILLGPGLSVTDCPQGTTVPFVGHGGLSAPNTCHGCACSPSPANCKPASIFHGSGCTVLEGVAPGVCTPTMIDTKELSAGTPTQQAGSCTMTNGSAAVLDPIAWKSDFVACKPTPSTSTNSCAPTTERCLPASPNARVCVYREGDVPDCPPGPYAIRELLHEGVTDGRVCGACDCGGAASSVNCGGIVSLFASSDCTGNPTNSLPTGAACQEASRELRSPRSSTRRASARAHRRLR